MSTTAASVRDSSVSCGLLLYRVTAKNDIHHVEYLLIQASTTGTWLPPKGGHESTDATHLDAALRETAEECAIEVGMYDVDDAFGRQTVEYLMKCRRRTKTVHFWLARMKSSHTAVRLSHEHTAHAWLPLIDACARVLHSTDRHAVCRMLHDAQAHIDKKATEEPTQR